MTGHPADVHVLDHARLSLGHSTVRVPAAASAHYEELARLVAEVNELWARATAEAEELGARARREGYEAGRAEALAELSTALADGQARAAEFVAASQSRVLAVAMAVVRRILPGLTDDALVGELAVDAIRAAHWDAGTTVYVHPGAVTAVAERLERWAAEHGARTVPHVIGNDDMGPEDVVVDSAAGTVRAGLSDRVEAIETALRAAAQAADGTGRE